MELNTVDLDYINHRMDTYDIKYQEVYDEIRDHVLVAILAARESGDEREIEYVYNDMMEAQFPGYYPFEKIAIAHEKAYRTKIKKMVWKNAGHYLKPLNAIMLGLAIVAGYYVPENKTTYIILLAVLLIVAVWPFIYLRNRSAEIKVDNGKRSIVKTHIKAGITYCFAYYLGTIGANFFMHGGWSATFEEGSQHPRVNIIIIAFALIYGLSITRLCRQEIKGPMLNIYE